MWPLAGCLSRRRLNEIIVVGVGASGQLGYLAEVATSNKAITGVAGTTAGAADGDGDDNDDGDWDLIGDDDFA